MDKGIRSDVVERSIKMERKHVSWFKKSPSNVNVYNSFFVYSQRFAYRSIRMDNPRSDSNGGSRMAKARYEYTTVDNDSSQSPSYGRSLFRRSPLWTFFLVMCCSLKILVVIGMVIILSLIPVYLSRRGNHIAVENTNDGISIIARTTLILTRLF